MASPFSSPSTPRTPANPGSGSGNQGSTTEKPGYVQRAQDIAQNSSNTSPRRRGKRPVDPLGPQSPTPIRKSASQLTPRQSAAATGTSTPKALRRDAVQPSRILWATEASWLSSAVDQLAIQRNTVELDEDDTMMTGAKVIYFIHNDVRADNVESLLKTLHAFPTDSLKSPSFVPRPCTNITYTWGL